MTSFNALTELEELRLFMQERAQAFDDSLDTTVGSSFDTQVIQPLLVRLGPDPYNTPIRDFILGRLATEFPDLVLQDGEPLDDYAVKIMQILLEAFRRQIRQVSLNQSFANPQALNENEADNLGANFFQTRQQGGFASGVARIYFAAPQFQTVTPSNPCLTADGLQFFPVENQSITASQMLFREEDNLFYFDIAVRSEAQGEEYNIDPNTLVRIDGVPAAVKVTNKIQFEGGLNTETNEEFIERIEQSLTEKSLVTTRGINARLLDVFSSIRLIQPIGYGDPEMNRDILTGGSSSTPYAYAQVTITAGSDEMDLYTVVGSPIIGPSVVGSTFVTAGVLPGDIIDVPLNGPGEFYSFTVVAVESGTKLKITPVSPASNGTFTIGNIRRALGTITISDIPGGILEPETDAGTIEINDDEVHIGGAVDVFIRGGDPQERDTTLEGILDGNPLRFGVDLKSVGNGRLTVGGTDDLVQVTEEIVDGAAIPSTNRLGQSLLGVLDEVVVKINKTSTEDYYPWVPSEDDVGRYIQFTGGSVTPEFGTYEILEFLGQELFGLSDEWAGRFKISLTDEESGGTLAASGSTGFDTDFRIIEQISIKDRVQDRDGSTTVIAANTPTAGDPAILGGVNFETSGAVIGDSVVIETGDDAGVYSIRRILSWLSDNDTLILDRELTQSVVPPVTGSGLGLRYRVADELDVNLVEPRIPKVPLGSIFTGGDLSTIAGSTTVSFTGTTNLILAGVGAGDTLEILEGDNEGVYEIVSVTGTTAELLTAPSNTQGNLNFEIYTAFTGIERPLVRVESVELLDSNSQPTGITIPYGKVIDARITGTLSNRAEGTAVESFTGDLQNNGSGLIDLEDTNIASFEAEEVKVGWRLNILNGNSVGSYTIAAVGTADGLPSDSHIRIDTTGGDAFEQAESPVHYSIGVASAGFARLYFLEPTSAEITTGLAGGRMVTEDGKEFRFSFVQGYSIVPAAGEEDTTARDLRLARSDDVGGGDFNSLLELTDTTRPGVYELELQEDDVVEVNEQIQFCDSAGDRFEELGIFGPAAGLRTITGSNLVSIPANSVIDFEAMNLSANGGPIVGQILIIEDGPDAGQYYIEDVVSTKSLRLSSPMTSFTHEIKGRDINPRTDVSLAASGVNVKITDTNDGAQLKQGAVGEFITIFESTRGDIDGTYEISDLLSAEANTIEFIHGGAFTDPTIANDPLGTGPFSWVRTDQDTNVEQPFNIYKAVPTELEIIEVAPKRADVITGPNRGTIDTSANKLTDDAGTTLNAKQGDIIEVLEGQNAGIYFLSADTVGADAIIFPNPPFPADAPDVPYRIWGGLHGSRRMVRVGPYESDNGNLYPGYQQPYTIRRRGVERVSSTTMQDNYDGFLYYLDIQIESQGSGDDLNLSEGTRLIVESGVRVDGYTYTVENETLTFSVFEEVSLEFDRRFLPVGNSDSPENLTEISGRNLRINYETSTVTRLANDLIRSDQDRPINASPIARHFLPSYLYASFVYSGGPAEVDVGPDMETYINNLGALDEVEVSDLEAFLTTRGATSVEHPLELVTVTHDLSRDLVVNRSDNKLGGLDDVPYNGTGRISAFFTTLGETLILDRE